MSAEPGDEAILAREALVKFSHGDPDFEREAMDLFLETARQKIDVIAAPDSPRGVLVEAAHTLKGNAQMIGAHRLGTASEHLELRASTEPDLEGLRLEVLERWRELLAHLGRD